MFPATSSNEGQVVVTASPKTFGGQPARFDGAIRVTKLDGEATFTQDPATPLDVTLVSGETPGVSTFLFEADADLGAGTTLIQDTVEFTVTGANAAAFGFTVGAETPKVAAGGTTARR